MKRKPFGLDIGATTIKLVSLDKKKDGYSLNAALSFPSPAKGILSESLFEQEEMAQVVRKIVKEAKVDSQLVNVALPESQVYTRVIEMPILSDKELSSAVYWEAEQYIPVPLTNLTIDWKVLGRREDPLGVSKMDVLLIGAPVVLIEKYQVLLSYAGLTIDALETEIISAVRVLSFRQINTTLSSMVVHIGAINTSLAIMTNGVITFTYSVPVGGAAINRAISADFGFSIAQAEEYKRTYGISDKMLGGKIGKSTEPILSSILSEVKKAIAFYTEKYKSEHPIQQILLSGGTAKLPGIDLFFAKNCSIETIIANPWNVLVSQEIQKDVLENASQYTIAVGLAMREHE